MRGELQALLQTSNPNRPTQEDQAQAEDATRLEGENRQDAANASLAKEAVQERTNTLVSAFDGLTKGDLPSPTTDAGDIPEAPKQALIEPPAQRGWADRVKPSSIHPVLKEQREKGIGNIRWSFSLSG